MRIIYKETFVRELLKEIENIRKNKEEDEVSYIDLTADEIRNLFISDNEIVIDGLFLEEDGFEEVIINRRQETFSTFFKYFNNFKYKVTFLGIRLICQDISI